GRARAGDDGARAAAERGEVRDRGDRRVVALHREELRRADDREVVEPGAGRRLLRLLAVDRLDAHERREALAATGRPRRAARGVARRERGAPALAAGDVGLAPVLELRHPRAVLADRDDAGDGLARLLVARAAVVARAPLVAGAAVVAGAALV